GYARATTRPTLEFPRDHGPHDAFRTEWWYWTGNVATAAGRAFGFELVFFRHALAPPGEPRAASLASRELVVAHAAVTDGAGAAPSARCAATACAGASGSRAGGCARSAAAGQRKRGTAATAWHRCASPQRRTSSRSTSSCCRGSRPWRTATAASRRRAASPA